MCSCTDSRACPSLDDILSNEFIVYSFGDLHTFASYLKFKDVIVNSHFDNMFSDYKTTPVETYPGPGSAAKAFDDFFEELDSRSSQSCFFIDISAYSYPNTYKAEPLKLLGEYCGRKKDKVFSVCYNVLSLSKAKKIFHTEFASKGFKWTKIRKLSFSAEDMEQMAKLFILDETVESSPSDISDPEMIAWVLDQPETDPAETEYFFTENKYKTPKTDPGRAGKHVIEPDDDETVNSILAKLEAKIQELKESSSPGPDSFEKPLYRALDSAFSGCFEEACICLKVCPDNSDSTKTALAFFQRYSAKPNGIKTNPYVFFADTHNAVCYPIRSMLQVLEDIDNHNYQRAFSLLKLIPYSGWKKISFVWNALLWNSTVRHPDAALICLLAKYLHIAEFRNLIAMRESIQTHYGKFGNNMPPDYRNRDANVLNYFINGMHEEHSEASMAGEREQLEKNCFSAADDMLSGFSGDVYFYCLFKDLYNKSRFKSESDDPEMLKNIRDAVNAFERIHFKKFC